MASQTAAEGEANSEGEVPSAADVPEEAEQGDALHVQVGTPLVVGAVSRDIVLRVARHQQPALDRCAASTEPPVDTAVTLALYLRADGQVAQAGIASPPQGAEPWADCVAQAARAWVFPEESCGGSGDRIELPLTLVRE